MRAFWSFDQLYWLNDQLLYFKQKQSIDLKTLPYSLSRFLSFLSLFLLKKFCDYLENLVYKFLELLLIFLVLSGAHFLRFKLGKHHFPWWLWTQFKFLIIWVNIGILVFLLDRIALKLLTFNRYYLNEFKMNYWDCFTTVLMV